LHIDALVPLPLFPSKERRRGFNQSTVLCEGIATVLGKPVLKEAVVRATYTESQTKKNRIERWQNMEGRFEVVNKEALEGKHILLVDDVVTTGATLEACGRELLAVDNVQLSIATLCFSSS
jgi:ComF family protein